MMLKSWGAESKLVSGEELGLRTRRRPDIYTVLCVNYTSMMLGGKK